MSSGGLLQIITSGKEDIFLTVSPEITFFKKVYKKHTNFSIELREINSNQFAEYNSIVSFNLNNIGDAIHRCYLEIDLPLLSFNDNYINNPLYINKKNTEITNLKSDINNINYDFNNLNSYINIEISLYRSLYLLLLTSNININTLKNEVLNFNYINKTQKDLYINKIDTQILNNINISSYISSINKLITNDTNYDTNIYISRTTIINDINKLYENMLYYLKDFNNNKNYYLQKLNTIESPNQINFNYCPYLGHNYFQYFNIEIGGVEYQKYSNHVLHINQSHNIKSEYMDNYNNMIGHTKKLNEFNPNPKGNTKVLVPLQFWFNRVIGTSLPLISLQYANVIINAKINDITNIISFENYELMYDEILDLTINNIDKFIVSTHLIYSSYKFDAVNKLINYKCIYINDELLKLKFPDLLENEINILLTENGTLYNNSYVINKNQWIGLMININKYNFNYKIAYYYPFINFNMYYSLINTPQIKLICETIYLDNDEREKFANSKLEYVVEIFEENVFNIKNLDNFDCELSFNSLSKELLWFIQPQIFIDKLTPYGQNMNLLYDYNSYFNNEIIDKHNLLFNLTDVLLNNINMNYYTYLLSYKYLNNILPNGIYYQSFSLYPEESQPSGAINLRQIKGKQYILFFNKQFIEEYNIMLNQLYKNNNNNKKSFNLTFISKNYNLLVIHKGMSQLLF
jgi:hypothetical protein